MSMHLNPNPRLFSFAGGREGLWQVMASRTVIGDGLPAVDAVSVMAGSVPPVNDKKTWVLRGVMSHDRYVTRPEKQQLLASQPALGRPEADCAVLIPIRKNGRWWALTQDERREIFEARSHHTQIGLDALPSIARRLHHCRDMAEAEPFDFITWFEFAAKDVAVFDRTLERLRISEEWSYVDREVEIRLRRTNP